MMEIPKYVLTFEASEFSAPYCIWEQAMVDGSVKQRRVSSFSLIDTALQNLSQLNMNKPIIIAYSTKLMDNNFTI